MLKQRAPFLVAFLLVAVAYWAQAFNFLDYKLMDLRFTVLARPASGSFLLIDIDPKSIKELGVWPWPRTFHAKLIDALESAKARRVAIDVDFSSRSSPSADADLARALADAGGKVVLPVFRQFNSSDRAGTTVVTTPPPALADHALLAFSNIRPEADSLVRRMETTQVWNGRTVPTFPAAMANISGKDLSIYFIDYAIRPETIRRISYADVLNGRADPGLFRDKVILIGATAIELGDQLAVPVYQALPGPIVQGLAYESIVQGRAIQRLGVLPVLSIAFLIAVAAGPWLAAQTWRRGLVALTSIWVASLALSTAVQATWPVSIDVMPWLTVSGLSFLIGLFGNLDRQSLRIFLAGMAASHTRNIMHHMANNASDGIILVGQGGAIEMFNPAAERIFGRPASAVTGMPVSTVIPTAAVTTPAVNPETPSPPAAVFPAAWIGGGVREILATRGDGTTFPMEIVVTETELKISRHQRERRSAHRGILMCVVRDISERKYAEQRIREELERRVAERTAELKEAQEQLLRSERLATLGQLTATVSHELRNPLGTIRSSAFVVRESVDHGDERIDRALERIDRNVERCDRIIDELLDFTRVRPLNLQLVAVDDWLKDLVESLNLPDGIRRDFDLGCGRQAVSFDPESLRRCIINVHENACHALAAKQQRRPDGDLRLVIRTGMARGRLEILVEDSGIGIKPDVLPRIFEPLFSTKGFGVGLGLVITRRIMKMHAGDVEISSIAGEGTRVLLWIPLAT